MIGDVSERFERRLERRERVTVYVRTSYYRCERAKKVRT